MTTQPQRRTRRPAARPVRPRGGKSSLGADIFIAVIVLIVAVLLFQALPGPIQTGILIVVAAGLGVTAVVGATKILRRPLPGQARTLAQFRSRTPTEFEYDVRDIARATRGVRSAEVQGGANDRGCDVLVTLDSGDRIMIQCKRYTGSVGSEHVQIANGTYRDIHGCRRAVIVTTSTFTAAALETKRRIGDNIRLLDGAQLVAWANGGRPPWN